MVYWVVDMILWLFFMYCFFYGVSGGDYMGYDPSFWWIFGLIGFIGYPLLTEGVLFVVCKCKPL
jgi:hypothetical protein